jgi:hypothetical protein
MTQIEFKWANQLFWQVKGHLIPDSWSLSDIRNIEESYFSRLWGNHESVVHLEGFEEAWKEKQNGVNKNSTTQ